jgi:hypothetical protein
VSKRKRLGMFLSRWITVALPAAVAILIGAAALSPGHYTVAGHRFAVSWTVIAAAALLALIEAAVVARRQLQVAFLTAERDELRHRVTGTENGIAPAAAVGLRLPHPHTQRLVVDAEVTRDLADRTLRLEREPHRPLTQLQRNTPSGLPSQQHLLPPGRNLVREPPRNSGCFMGVSAAARGKMPLYRYALFDPVLLQPAAKTYETLTAATGESVSGQRGVSG